MKTIELTKLLSPYKKYENKWVALNFNNTKLLGYGKTIKEATKNALKNSDEEPVVFKVPSSRFLLAG